MPVSHHKEGTLGFLTYLFAAGAVVDTLLLGGLLLGSDLIQSRLSFPSLGPAFDDGWAFVAIVIAFFVTMPLIVTGVAVMFGRRAAYTGHPAKGPAAINALIGVPLSYVFLAVTLVIVSALVGEDGQFSALEAVLDLLVEGLVWLLVALGPLVAYAAFVAGATAKAFGPAYAGAAAQAPTAHAAPEPADEPHPWPDQGDAYADESDSFDDQPAGQPAEGNWIQDYPVTCIRCTTEFAVSGERPLRIACPNCGKGGTIR